MKLEFLHQAGHAAMRSWSRTSKQRIIAQCLTFASLRNLRCLMCIRVHDAALSCKLVQERLRNNTNEISALSCTAAGTDAPWVHTPFVSSSLIFIFSSTAAADDMSLRAFLLRVVSYKLSHPKKTEVTSESWCTKSVAKEGLASWRISACNHLHLMPSAAWDICHFLKSPKSHCWQGRGEMWEWSGTIFESPVWSIYQLKVVLCNELV